MHYPSLHTIQRIPHPAPTKGMQKFRGIISHVRKFSIFPGGDVKTSFPSELCFWFTLTYRR